MVCLNRLSQSVFSNENTSHSNSSGVSDGEAVSAYRQDSVRVPPVHMRPTPMYNRQRRHVNVRLSNNFSCDICNRPHGNMSELREHRNVHFMPINDLPHSMTNGFATLVLTKHALGGHACEYDLVSHEACSDVQQFFKCRQV